MPRHFAGAFNVMAVRMAGAERFARQEAGGWKMSFTCEIFLRFAENSSDLLRIGSVFTIYKEQIVRCTSDNDPRIGFSRAFMDSSLAIMCDTRMCGSGVAWREHRVEVVWLG